MLWTGVYACKIIRLNTGALRSIYRPVTRRSSCNMLSSVTISLTSSWPEQGDIALFLILRQDGCHSGNFSPALPAHI